MSDDFLVTHICSADECNHVWLYPDAFDHACPSCGTTIPPVSVDVLAGRRQKRAVGLDLPPLVMSPDKGTPMHEQFTRGVRQMRELIIDMEAQAQRLTDYASQTESERGGRSEDPLVQAAHGAAREARNQVSRLLKAERLISALFILGDDAESFAGVGDHRAEASAYATITDFKAGPTIQDGSPCPKCPGTLKAMKQTPIYLICGNCGATYTSGDPRPLKRQQDAYTGQIINTGPRAAHIAQRVDDSIAAKIKENSADRQWQIPEVDE